MQKLERTVFVEICKKIGKNELATVIALYLLYTDKGPSADVVEDFIWIEPNLALSKYRRNWMQMNTEGDYNILIL